MGENTAYPGKFRLRLRVDDKSALADAGEHPGPIDVHFDKPKKVKLIRFEITEPKLEPRDIQGKSPAWSIYSIRITEVKLFGKWLKRDI
jgi:hypothetical protein